MIGRWKFAALVVTAGVFGAATAGWGAASRPAKDRPEITEIGDPVPLDHELLRREAAKNSGMREYIDHYGWPDYAEVQRIAAQEPWAAYEVHLYYLRRMRDVIFGHVKVSPALTDYGIKKFDGRISPETLARLLGPVPTAEPTPQATPVPSAPLPPVETKKIVLRGVYFDFDKSEIRPDARPVLDEGIRVLKEQGAVKVAAEGHTDSVGTEEYNQKLSLRRAEAVKAYLVAGGIAPERVQVTGFGEVLPVASNDTEDGRAQNRRVELRLIQK